ncbi:MAG TPA: inorganic phosphate transporter [Bryobacteraceae bacterium]|nr:inorganic phosphate transporter [Bryobacteraceae bacterium]
MSTFSLVVLIISIALVFDFINGFHDAANSIATVVATRVLPPLGAVVWAAFFNFVAAFTFGTKVADTVGKGFVDLSLVTPYVILAGVAGAIIWDLITWWLSLPTSSSHALIGGYAGATLARTAFLYGFGSSLRGLIVGKWPSTVAFIVLSPLVGLLLAYALMVMVYWAFRKSTPAKMDKYFRKLQLLSAAAFSFAHGSNDAQKTMGIIAAVLFSAKYLPAVRVPVWVIFSAHAAIGLGTLSGGWRIVRTMGGRITRLKPRGGFCAETAAALSIFFPTALGLPVSTTHVIAGSITGVGSFHRIRAVRWGIATDIVWAWILTIPASAAFAWVTFMVIRYFVPGA